MPERGSISQKVREFRRNVGEIFQTREGLEAQSHNRTLKLEEMRISGELQTLPLHEIEEKLGHDEFPFVDKWGNQFPSLAETRRKRAKREKVIAKFLQEPPKR